MGTKELYELYNNTVDSRVSFNSFEEEVAWLISENWSVESIFFSIGFGGKYYREQLSESLKETLDTHKVEMLRYYMLAKQKQEIQKSKEGAQKYDSTNEFKRADKPSWFRKGIDFNLFE